MLTKKKQALTGLWIAVAWLFLLAGCSPSGPEALLAGKQMLDRGQPERAVRRFREATSLMPTNAFAWAYLGLAQQQAGALTSAGQAYDRALSLNPKFAEVRINLGCLRMQQEQWAEAREQLVAATLLQRDSVLAWQQLGEAQVRLGQYDAAVRSLGEALRLNQTDADTWNWLGVAQFQQGRTQEAARSFQTALRLQANHGHALLNLAILTQEKLRNPGQALELYHRYLAFLPNAPNAKEVRRLADRLEAEPGSQTRSALTAKEPERGPPETAATVSVNPAAGSTSTLPSRQAAASAAPTAVQPARSVETVTVTPAPTIATTINPQDARRAPSPSTETGAASAPRLAESPRSLPEAATSEAPKKRGFFAKINPLNLFKKRTAEKQPTPLPERADQRQNPAGRTVDRGEARAGSAQAAPTTFLGIEDAARFKRYVTQWPVPPVEGHRRAAERALERAEAFRKRGRSVEAAQAYLEAVRADPADFKARFNLGLMYLDAGEFGKALPEFEAATRIEPDSVPARYNFALALKWADYPVDSAIELVVLLRMDPKDARAHLALGNLYAQQFGNKTRAREHYARVLELDPGHPQAGAIRIWLAQNKP